MIQGVLFDLDGTLIDSRADLVASVNAGLIQAGRPAQSADQIVPHVGNGMAMLIRGVLGPHDAGTFDLAVHGFNAHYERHCVDSTVAYTDVNAGLAFLSSGAALGGVTNNPEGLARTILTALGLMEFIRVVVGGDTLPQRKPDPAPVRFALEKINVAPAEALMVGDGEQDLDAAQRAGVRTCLVRYGYGFRPETMALRPDFVIDGFSQLKEIVK
jgi:phosphoglycolate phosphatase